MTNYRQTMSQALEYMHFVKETSVLERELTDKELKRREEIAKDLDDQEFKDRYGKDWMQVKMGTATKMAKAEDLDEKADVSLKKKAEKSGISASILKQVYNRGVAAWRTGHRPGTTPEQWGHARVNSFISKSSGTWGGADKDLAAKAKGQKEEVELDEVGGAAFGGTIDKIQKVVDDKQATKIDGVMVDTFTASLIMNIFNKVNKQNQDKMRKMKVTQLAKAAYKLAGVKEEVELDERMKLPRQLIDTNKEVMLVKKNKVIVVDKKDQDKYMKQGWILAEEVELDEVFNGTKKDIRKIARATDNALRKRSAQIQKMLKSKTNEKGRGLTDFEFDHISDEGDAIAAELVYRKKGGKDPISDDIPPHLKKFVNEELDLDEGKMQDVWQKKNAKSLSVGPFELLRGKSGVHTIKRSGKVIGDFSYDSDADNFVANIKGMKGQFVGDDIDSLFTHLQKNHKEEIEEASAAADARRAMRRDPDMKQRAFSKDDSATDDDKKAASKNIMVQMRKAQSLRGKFDVEFQDGKKVKIPAKMAIAVQQKYNSMRKPADKEKFQAKVAKSYKDMLTALKEQGEAPAAATPDYKAGGKSKADEYRQKAKQMVGTEGFASDAQRKAAFASGYKEKGKKNKKESVLDRIDKKLKEIKNG